MGGKSDFATRVSGRQLQVGNGQVAVIQRVHGEVCVSLHQVIGSHVTETLPVCERFPIDDFKSGNWQSITPQVYEYGL